MRLLQDTGTLSDNDVPGKVLAVIAGELQIPVEELEDDTEFSELGVDALVAPGIIARVAKAAAIQLPEDVFETFATVSALRRQIASLEANSIIPPIRLRPNPDPGPPPAAVPVLIRKSSKPDNKQSRNLFLLPDGSGAAMAYARLPALPHANIYALNSPFLQSHKRYTCTVEEVARIFADGIVSIQPTGPYLLGGWSAGGYYAFEVAKELMRRGQRIEALVLIDSPCRTDFEALPLPVVRYLAASGLMGDAGARRSRKAAPPWVVDHFAATLRAVERYVPERLHLAFGKEEVPVMMRRVFLVWASEALLSEDQAASAGLDPNVKVTRLLLQARPEFGPGGWEKLFPAGTELRIATVACNHFEVVHPPNAKMLGELLRDVINPEGEAGWVHEWRQCSAP
ncbi:Alpha/Beta hydrolase protein [Corynascus similis CBS 632.67]